MLPIQFIKNCNKHNKLVLQTYAVHREDTTREDNRDWLAIRSTNSFYRDGEIKGQI